MSAQEELEKLTSQLHEIAGRIRCSSTGLMLTTAIEIDNAADRIAAIRDGLGKAQEPVRWMCPDHGDVSRVQRVGWLPLYREAPPADSAQVLVDAQWREQYDEMRYDYQRYQDGDTMMPFSTFRLSLALFLEETDKALAAHKSEVKG